MPGIEDTMMTAIEDLAVADPQLLGNLANAKAIVDAEIAAESDGGSDGI